jgi:hypothetical protein
LVKEWHGESPSQHSDYRAILDNPKIIRDQQSIELNLEWAANAPENTFLKVILRGTAVIKA